MKRFTSMLSIAAALVLVAAPPVTAQVATTAPAPVAGAKPVKVERITVHSPSIAGNLEGETADRDVLVILPPSYAKDEKRRYPVVYALHGYSIGAQQWAKEIHVPQTVESAFAKGARDMIIVMPDSKTIHNGSMYSSSVTTGDFERFISHDLVRYIDSHYRTIADRASRGLAGHSMGGYGTARIGMKHADMFGAIYMMSPCCLSPRSAAQMDPATTKLLESVKTPADSASLPFMARAQLATAAAWSPNPEKAPLFLDLPDGDAAQRDAVLAKWAANAPLAFIDQYVGDLRRYKAIAIDVGNKDGLKDDARTLHERLDNYGIASSFEIYDGDHTSHVASRFQDHLLPFFSQHLTFPSSK